MRQLVRSTARLFAALLLLAVMIVPVVAVAVAASNPVPGDLLTRLSTRNVDDVTIIKLLSVCFYICWAWFCLPALRQLRPSRPAPVRARTPARRAATTSIPAVAVNHPKTAVGRGPRGALARLASFAVSSATVISSLTAGAASAAPVVRAPAVVPVVGAPEESVDVAASVPTSPINSATTLVAQHRDTPYAIASRHFPADQLDAAREEILELNVGRLLPDGSTYRGGGFPAGWDVVVPKTATTANPVVAAAGPAVSTGHVVAVDESYWSISETQLRVELGRKPTPQEILERTNTAIAYNAPRLGYDNPKMLRPGDIVFVDSATLAPSASTVPAAVATDSATGSGHVVAVDESYWSISETQLRVELSREPTPREVLERVEAAIAYNAPRLGYDDEKMLHPGDVIFVDAATLSPVTAVAPVPVPVEPTTADTPDPAPASTNGTPAVTDAPADEVGAAPSLPTTAGPTTPAPHDSVDAPVPPAASTTAVTPPVTAAPPVTQQVTAVEQQDMLSSRWLFGEIAITSLGLVGAWQTVKQLRRRRRRWLGLQPTHEAVTAPTERERDALVDVAMLRQFVDPARLASTGACAVVLGDHPEIRFRVPTPPPPAGWDLTDRAWRRNDTEPLTAAPVLSPALVTIGHGVDDSVSAVVLDLLTAGTVSVTGDRVAVERLMCSMLWELACAPLGDQVELHIVGLACAAARHAVNAGRLVSMDEAIATAQSPHPGTAQVFLVDPFADDTATGSLRELVDACAPGSGRAVVVAGPCGHPTEEISVPSEHRAMWDSLTLVPPQLPESVDVELDRMLDSVVVGRRPASASSVSLRVPDPEAEAVALRSTFTVVLDDGSDDALPGDDVPAGSDGSDDDGAAPSESARPAGDRSGEEVVAVGNVDVPPVMLAVCGQEVGVRGHPTPQATSVLFVLAAANRAVAASELAEHTGYAIKSISTVFTANHELIERESGTLRLADHVWTDHRWATRCVTQLADAMRVEAHSADTARWMLAALEALQALEQGPFAVLPATRERARSGATPWGWIDDFPADAPARKTAETEIAEAALAFSELWLAAPRAHRIVRAEQIVAELCRLAATVPYAHVVRQLRPSMWTSGADCLLSAAARVAAQDETLLDRVQQSARTLAARGHLDASNELAEELGL